MSVKNVDRISLHPIVCVDKGAVNIIARNLHKSIKEAVSINTVITGMGESEPSRTGLFLTD